jgi:type IV secretion system protein VirB2
MKSLAVIFVFAGVLLSLDAQAASAGGAMPWDGPINQIRASLTGPVALAISVLGILAAGATLIFMGGEIGLFIKTVLYLVLVISLVVAAQNFLQTVMGAGAVITPPETEIRL